MQKIINSKYFGRKKRLQTYAADNDKGGCGSLTIRTRPIIVRTLYYWASCVRFGDGSLSAVSSA